jgi:hypothetical protein
MDMSKPSHSSNNLFNIQTDTIFNLMSENDKKPLIKINGFLSWADGESVR